jgi:hypothetical protein
MHHEEWTRIFTHDVPSATFLYDDADDDDDDDDDSVKTLKLNIQRCRRGSSAITIYVR